MIFFYIFYNKIKHEKIIIFNIFFLFLVFYGTKHSIFDIRVSQRIIFHNYSEKLCCQIDPENVVKSCKLLDPTAATCRRHFPYILFFSKKKSNLIIRLWKKVIINKIGNAWEWMSLNWKEIHKQSLKRIFVKTFKEKLKVVCVFPKRDL